MNRKQLFINVKRDCSIIYLKKYEYIHINNQSKEQHTVVKQKESIES